MDYVLTGASSKQVDNYCIYEIGIPSVILMERAALTLAEETINYLNNVGNKNLKLLIVCMAGNNGADGLAAARILSEKGYICGIYIAGKLERATEEFNLQLQIIQKMGLEISYMNDEADVEKFKVERECVIIDALFGIGLSREVSGMYALLIEKINQSQNYVIAADIASGLNPATGSVMGAAVRADKTVTFGALKAGHLLCEGRAYSGDVVVKDIGLVKSAYEQVKKENPTEIYGCFTKEDLQIIPKRNKTSNKGTYKTVNIIGAGENMSGAAALSAAAAYRCGSGLVKVFADDKNAEALKILIKEAVIQDYSQFDGNSVSCEKDIIIIGPGLSTGEKAVELVENVLKTQCKIVIDADALNVIGQNRILLERLNADIIITPHIKEMSRLINKDTDYIRKNIVSCAREFSMKYGCVTVIKDASTVIGAPDGRILINKTGNSGMSKGGSGDVLTGIIGGMISQNLSVYEAACMGVYLHGMAGDYAAVEKSEYSLLASDLLEKLPEVFRFRMEN